MMVPRDVVDVLRVACSDTAEDADCAPAAADVLVLLRA
jgi:hypothetical protein